MSTDSDKSHTFDFDDFGEEWPDKGTLMMTRDGGDGGSSCSASENAIRSMELEQEILNSSLLSLTSHFAKVQLRLRQVMEAPAAQRDGKSFSILFFLSNQSSSYLIERQKKFGMGTKGKLPLSVFICVVIFLHRTPQRLRRICICWCT